jgi:dGTPase
VADDIAYNNHDLHDGLRAELFSTDELAELPLLDRCFQAVDQAYPGLNYYRRRHEALRRFFGLLVEDVIAVARAEIADVNPKTPQDIRLAGRSMVRFSDAVFEQLKVIRQFLFTRMYRAPEVVKVRAKVTRIVKELFPLYQSNPDLLPKQWRKDVAEVENEIELARIVLDYIAGMTDRFAILEHDRLIGGVDVTDI